jgi:hypothetical protein
VRHGEKAGVDRPQPLLVGRAERGEVGAAAERRRRTGDHHRAHALVALALGDQLGQPRGHRQGQRVAAIGIVQRDDRDTAAPLEEDRHAVASQARRRPKSPSPRRLRS